MRRLVFFFIFIFLTLNAVSQDLKTTVCCRTYYREFKAMGFTHIAQYKFEKDRIIYQVHGYFIDDSYVIVGNYLSDRFEGYDPKSGEKYVIYFRYFSPQKIIIKKQGVDTGYEWITNRFPVEGWHEYFSNSK